MKASSVCALLLISLAGCGKEAVSETDLVGHWTGGAKMQYSAMQEDASGESEQATFFADHVEQQKTMKLELKQSGSAVFVLDSPIDGTWKLEGDTVTLVLPARNGASEGATFSGTYAFKLSGTDEMEGSDPNVAGYTITFTK